MSFTAVKHTIGTSEHYNWYFPISVVKCLMSRVILNRYTRLLYEVNVVFLRLIKKRFSSLPMTYV